jgi:NAD(P)H-hydrate epimerase
MKTVVTSSEMKSLDLLASKKFSIPLVLLMENAGAEIARYVIEYLNSNKINTQKILIVAGPGNNGGDGIVVARHLLNICENISILLLILTKHPYQGDAKTNYEIINSIAKTDNRIKIIENKLSGLSKFKPDIVIDAIFGTGFKGKSQGINKNAIRMINNLSGYKMAIDIPSGINGDNGSIEGLAVKANTTITMGLIKQGHLLYPGKEYCGDVKIANLGVSYDEITKSETFLLDDDYIRCNIPKRKPDGHKGTFGSVLVVAGGIGYSGAACLTSLGALHSGAGLVRLCFPENINTAVEKKLTEVIKVPLPATKQGSLAISGYDKIKEIASKSNVAAIGPGVTTNQEIQKLIRKVISSTNLPMVIDADGLNNITMSDLLKIPKQRRLKIVLTPHPGEFERLFKVESRTVNNNRIEIVREWAKKLSLIIVLKGTPTVIGDPMGNVYINSTGNSGLAKAGSGDVLTGMIAGFIAQGASPVDAACLGVYLHGCAADIAVKTKTEYSLVATDLIRSLPRAIASIIS